MGRLFAAGLIICVGVQLGAQQPAFRAGVELVTVPAAVTTLDHNTYISGLTAADFQLSENGDRQVVTTVTQERRPVSLCFVVDSSSAMGLGFRKELAIETAQRIVGQLQPDDEISIVFFGRIVEERLPWTRIADIAKLDWGGWRPDGVAPLNDGIRLGLTLIEKARNTRHVIALLTPGFESGSRISTSSIVKTRQQSETTVFAFGIGSSKLADLQADDPHVRGKLPPGSSETLRQFEAIAPGAPDMVRSPTALPAFDPLEPLVGDSGGRVARVLSQPEVIQGVKNLIAQLNNEYLIGYSPIKPLDGKYRRIKVEVKRRGVFVRHREGYLALPSAP